MFAGHCCDACLSGRLTAAALSQILASLSTVATPSIADADAGMAARAVLSTRMLELLKSKIGLDYNIQIQTHA